jgi:glycosyltransferase involved in cell wall biosynthesis
VDDAIYVDPSDNSNLIADISDCVICGNNNLIEHYSKFSSNCVYLPTVENTALYEPYWNDTYDNKIIGWIGSKTTIDNLDLVIDALNTVTSRHQNVKIAIISNTALDYLDKIHNSYLISWNSETYIEEIGKFTIGIMPLKDNEINRGKCGFKMIQYLNMKKPVIGSGVGVNSDIIRGNGIEANSTEEWVDAMEELLFNRRFYNGLVNSIEKGFFEKYHYKKISSELIKILEGNANA